MRKSVSVSISVEEASVPDLAILLAGLDLVLVRCAKTASHYGGEITMVLRDARLNPPVVCWAAMPAWFDYVAQDSSGLWYAYTARPVLQEPYWRSGLCCIDIPEEYAPKFSGDWKESLCVRPGKG